MAVRKGKKMDKRILLLALIFVLSMALVLGGCSLFGGGDSGSLDVSAYTEEEEEEAGQEGDDRSGNVTDSDGPQAMPFEPMFPDHTDYIMWHVVPSDFIGGFGTGVEPREDGSGVVNVREFPSIDAEVVGQIRRGNDEWWVVSEVFTDAEGMHVGAYYVPADDYTWVAVALWNGPDDPAVKGWVASEVVEFWSV